MVRLISAAPRKRCLRPVATRSTIPSNSPDAPAATRTMNVVITAGTCAPGRVILRIERSVSERAVTRASAEPGCQRQSCPRESVGRAQPWPRAALDRGEAPLLTSTYAQADGIDGGADPHPPRKLQAAGAV